MEAHEQVNQVVNNLAEKIGVTAESLQPVAENLVQETAIRSWVVGSVAAVGATLCMIILCIAVMRLVRVYRECDITTTSDFIPGLIAIASGAGVTLFGHSATSNIANAVSPTLTLLEKLR